MSKISLRTTMHSRILASRSRKHSRLLSYDSLPNRISGSAGSCPPQRFLHTTEANKNPSEDAKTRDHLPNGVFYSGHEPTNFFQKALLAVGSATVALLDPTRADMIAVNGETTGYFAIHNMYRRMQEDSEGRLILQEKPRINSKTVDLEALKQYSSNTLARAYINFLTKNDVSPDTRLPVQFVDDPEMAYVMQRYREAHDLVHTLLGMPTNMLGEVAVKWVEGMQTGLPMCVGGGIFGPIRFRPKQRQKYLSTYLPWALRVGKEAKFLQNVYFEKRWDQDMDDLRRELRIEPFLFAK